MKQILIIAMVFVTFMSCKKEQKDLKPAEETTVEKTAKQLKEELTSKGFEIFDYIDSETQDTIIMQKYFIAFLKSGPNRSQPEDVAKKLQAAHMAHLGKMYELGYADISGPFDDEIDIQGITIYNVYLH